MLSAIMKKNFTLFAILFFFSIPQFCSSQEYFGSWTLDWSKVMEGDDHQYPVVSDTLKTINNYSDKNPIWVLSMDSLKVFQNGGLISTAKIKWTRNDRFEIIDDQKKKNPIHYIDHLEDGKIKMRTGYSDAEIYLRRL
ncbi:MAG TPA: hypothetical protein VJ949_11055 [Cryomorphaceae bacterium]|nr:hypothetical protein [Cryomorphaceae bacterium]